MSVSFAYYKVCCLGAVAFTSLTNKAAFVEFWSVGYHSYRWAGVELIARGLTSLFLMVLYLKIHARVLPLRNPDVRINHFLVTVLILGIMAKFVTILVDQHNGSFDRRVGYVINWHQGKADQSYPRYHAFFVACGGIHRSAADRSSAESQSCANV